MKAFDGLVKAGKVRAIGASNLSLWRIAEANLISRMNKWTEYSVVEQRYTYLRPRHGADFGPQIFISSDLKEYALAYGVALIGYSILLQGAYTRSDRPVPTQFAGPDSDERLNVLRAVAGEAGCSPSQAIIAWMRQSRPAILPIIAGSKIEQLRENIAALEIVLGDEQMLRLNAAGNPAVKQGWIQPS
jgi:aryl-alcohol dehydrogenase-like predicted oxidoreductase